MLALLLACTPPSRPPGPSTSDSEPVHQDDTQGDSSPDSPADSDPPVDGPLSLSVMGDIPYDSDEVAVLDEQVLAHNHYSSSLLVVHLGDIKAEKDPCEPEVYTGVAAQLRKLDVPTVVLPGDNEWNDCPDPDEAWGLWTASFSGFWTGWSSAPAIQVQAGRPANLAWVDGPVLLVALTLPGGRVYDEEAWAAMLADDLAWVREQLTTHGERAEVLVLLLHASPSADNAPFFEPLVSDLAAWDKPTLLLHADGHRWIEDHPWPEAPKLQRVQIEAGGDAPPVQVQIHPQAEEPFVLDREPY